MSNYTRSTRACSFQEIQPALQQEIRNFFLEHELIDLESQILMCCETRSDRIKTSAIAQMLGEDRDQRYTLVALLTPDWLVWARSGDRTKTMVAAAKLSDIHVRPRTFLRSKDLGIEIDGFVDGSFAKVHGYLALGPEDAAEAFWKALDGAVDIANPPRRLLDIFGKVPR